MLALSEADDDYWKYIEGFDQPTNVLFKKNKLFA